MTFRQEKSCDGVHWPTLLWLHNQSYTGWSSVSYLTATLKYENFK